MKNTIYKVIPFEEVAIGQAFEDHNINSTMTSYHWVKLNQNSYREVGHSYIMSKPVFPKGCLVRIADCEPVIESSVEGVLASVLIAMRDIQNNADDTLWINNSETVFERLWEIYIIHGGKLETLKEAFPLYA